MSKNMTRKGLALAVSSAFALTGLTAIPAQAADALSLGPSAGSGYTVLAGSDFQLSAGIPSSVPSGSYPFLKFRVQNASLTSTNVDYLKDSTGDTEDVFNYGATTVADGGGSVGDAEGDAVTDADFVVAPGILTVTGVSATDNEMAIGHVGSLVLKPASANTAYSVDVTAWLDVNNNNTIDAGENVSPTETVNFVKASTVTASATMVAPLVGDATLKARVAFSNADINVRQIDNGDVLVKFGTYASSTLTTINSFADNATTGAGTTSPSLTVTSVDVVNSNNNGNDVVWNSTDGVYEAVFTPVTTVSGTVTALSVEAATVYGAQVYLDQGNDGDPDGTDSTDAEGAVATTTTAAAATGYSVKWNVVSSADAKTTQVGYEDPGSISATGYTDDQGMTATVRTTSAGVSSGTTIRVFVGTDVTVPVAKKSVPVAITLTTGSDITLADALTVDGLSLYNGRNRTITKSTSATGIVEFVLSAGKVDDTDDLTFSLSVNGVAPGASTDGTVTWAVPNYNMYSTEDNAGNAGISTVSGGTYSMAFQVVDQWGAAPANGTYRLVGQDKASSNAERTTAADFAVTAPLVDGKGTLTVTDNGVGTGSYVFRAGYATVDGALVTTAADDYVDTTVKVVTDATPATITLDELAYGTEQLEDANADGDYSDTGDTDNRTKLILETEDVYSYYPNTAAPSESAPDVTANQEVTIAGAVTNAAGVAVPYAKVTLTASKVLFVDNSNYGFGSFTLFADASGEFSVNVYSKSGGVNNIVITSGAASATQKLTYAGAVAGAAADFTITTPSASEPGRTVDVTVKVVDENGNGVEAATITLSSTGPGYLINTSGTTLADGTYTTKLLVGANDAGTAVIKAVVSIDGDDVTKTSSVEVGVGAVAAADAKVNAGSFKGYVAIYAKGYVGKRLSAKVGKDWVIVSSLASNYERVVEYTGAGYTIDVPIYIDRVLVDTITVTTK